MRISSPVRASLSLLVVDYSTNIPLAVGIIQGKHSGRSSYVNRARMSNSKQRRGELKKVNRCLDQEWQDGHDPGDCREPDADCFVMLRNHLVTPGEGACVWPDASEESPPAIEASGWVGGCVWIGGFGRGGAGSRGHSPFTLPLAFGHRHGGQCCPRCVGVTQALHAQPCDRAVRDRGHLCRKQRCGRLT